MGYFVKNQKNCKASQMVVYQLLHFLFFPLLEAVMFRLWVLRVPCNSLIYEVLSFLGC